MSDLIGYRVPTFTESDEFGVAGAIPFAPHQQRVVDEKAELDDRAGKLNVFIGTEVFKGLPLAERGRMTRQLSLMLQLSMVLGERIAAF